MLNPHLYSPGNPPTVESDHAFARLRAIDESISVEEDETILSDFFSEDIDNEFFSEDRGYFSLKDSLKETIQRSLSDNIKSLDKDSNLNGSLHGIDNIGDIRNANGSVEKDNNGTYSRLFLNLMLFYEFIKPELNKRLTKCYVSCVVPGCASGNLIPLYLRS